MTFGSFQIGQVHSYWPELLFVRRRTHKFRQLAVPLLPEAHFEMGEHFTAIRTDRYGILR